MKENDLDKAIEIATLAHKGQVDKSGEDYIQHPLTLMHRVTTNEETCVAVHHDVIEDTSVTLQDLKNEGFLYSVVHAIDLLTKKQKDKSDYFGYLQKIKRDDLARVVKLADLTHNSDLSRISQVTSKDIERTKKYKDSNDFSFTAKCAKCGEVQNVQEMKYSDANLSIGYYCSFCFEKQRREYDEKEEWIKQKFDL